jgi:amino acid adenylation domain-containing protein
MLLHELFEATVDRDPQRVALACEGRRYRYGDIERAANALAQTMRASGVARGDRVALLLDNGVEAVIAIYAALKLGAVFMPVSPQTKAQKLAYLLNDARARCLVGQVSLRHVFEPALESAPSVTVRVVAGTGNGETPPAGEIRFDAAIAGDHSRPRDTGCIDQDLAALIYTSGSTGDPKGVMLTHLNMVSAARSISTYLGLRSDDVILCALPLSFDYGLYQVLMAFQLGAAVVLEKSFTFPARALEVMVAERVTVFPGVPTMFAMLLNMGNLGTYDLSALRLVTNTAAALPEEHIRRIRAAFPRATLFSMYGLTECKRVTYLPPEQLDIRPTSVGRGMPNEEWWLVDEQGNRLPHGSTGELVVRGSHVMRGYWEKPEATAERLRPGPSPGEQVLYTGDLFRTDAEGYLYFVGRKDDIIKSRGEKVSPREIENVLYALEGVREAAVIGVPDPVLGQAVKAFVALGDGCAYSEKDILRHCQGRLENYMVPKYVEIVAALPKTNTGKIRKTGLA